MGGIEKRTRRATDVDAFRRLAQRYCRLVGQHADVPLRDLLGRLHELVPALYASGVRLPVPELDELPDIRRVSHEEWSRLFLSLRRRLGNRDRYRQVFNEYDRSDYGVVVASLADDLADIYRDLVDGFRYWRRGYHSEAVWEWRFGIDYHWGEHATGAMRALYWLHSDHQFKQPAAMPNSTLQRLHSRVTVRAKKHGPRHAAHR